MLKPGPGAAPYSQTCSVRFKCDLNSVHGDIVENENIGNGREKQEIVLPILGHELADSELLAAGHFKSILAGIGFVKPKRKRFFYQCLGLLNKNSPVNTD